MNPCKVLYHQHFHDSSIFLKARIRQVTGAAHLPEEKIEMMIMGSGRGCQLLPIQSDPRALTAAPGAGRVDRYSSVCGPCPCLAPLRESIRPAVKG